MRPGLGDASVRSRLRALAIGLAGATVAGASLVQGGPEGMGPEGIAAHRLESASPAARTRAAGSQPTPSGDIAVLVPSSLGGVKAQVDVVRGEEHLAGLDRSDAEAGEQLATIRSFLEVVDASVEDMTTVTAVAIDGTTVSFLAGIQVRGADPQRLFEGYLELLVSTMASPRQEQEEIAGRTATLVTDGTLEGPPLYVYSRGPIIWLMVADVAVVEEVLAQLP